MAEQYRVWGAEAGVADPVLKTAVKGARSSLAARTTPGAPVATGQGQDSDQVRIGSAVTLRYGELEEAWRIVDPSEANSGRGWISAETPLAQALLGRRAGDQVTVRSAQPYAVTILHVG